MGAPAADGPHHTWASGDRFAGHGFLGEPAPTEALAELYADDVEEVGYVMNLSRVWGHLPDVHQGLFALVASCAATAGLTYRERAVLVVAAAATLGDSYCTLAWGGRLARAADAEVAVAVVRGDDTPLTPREVALAGWARAVAGDPCTTGSEQVQRLRDAGFDDRQVAAVTAFCALRLAFSTVNAALGAEPDAGLAAGAPPTLLEAVTFGRPVAADASSPGAPAVRA